MGSTESWPHSLSPLADILTGDIFPFSYKRESVPTALTMYLDSIFIVASLYSMSFEYTPPVTIVIGFLPDTPRPYLLTNAPRSPPTTTEYDTLIVGSLGGVPPDAPSVTIISIPNS